jgi:hypothetical protein
MNCPQVLSIPYINAKGSALHLQRVDYGHVNVRLSGHQRRDVRGDGQVPWGRKGKIYVSQLDAILNPDNPIRYKPYKYLKPATQY